jgi:hypothetical protein
MSGDGLRMAKALGGSHSNPHVVDGAIQKDSRIPKTNARLAEADGETVEGVMDGAALRCRSDSGRDLLCLIPALISVGNRMKKRDGWMAAPLSNTSAGNLQLTERLAGCP